MKTNLLILFLDTYTIAEYNHLEFTVLSVSRYEKLTRLLGFAADLEDAKSLIISSFSGVYKIITLSANIEFNRKLS